MPASSRPIQSTTILLLCCTWACAQHPESTSSSWSSVEAPAFSAAEAAIDTERLRRDIDALADDAMEGRLPGSRGDQRARAYIIQRLEELGLEPGIDGRWEQPVELVGITTQAPPSWRFETPTGPVDFDFFTEFIATSGVQSPSAVIDDAELVFVGYGIEAPEHDWDDYAGVDVEGKVLVMLNNDPDWDEQLFAGKRRLYYGRWRYKYEIAGGKRAAGAIIVHTTPSAGYPWQVIQTSWTGELFELPDDGEPRTPVEAWLTEEVTRKLLAAAGHDYDDLVERARARDFQPIPLGVRTSLSLENQLTRKESANVVGRLPGVDPELADQVVLYTAHHDHLGNTGDDPEDGTYNGALDNAAGVAQVLAIAEALGKLPTRRSALFAFVAAEEQGLLGSAYLARHPPVPAGRIAANINYDGANIWGRTEDVTFIGFGKSDLDEVVVAGAARQGREVFGDQFPDKGFFYRSDQFSLAKIGVPAIYLDTGTRFVGQPEGWGKEVIEGWTEQHYHQTSDELVDSWSFEGMIQDVQLGLYCGVVLGNQEQLPAWRPGDEFEAARLQALSK